RSATRLPFVEMIKIPIDHLTGNWSHCDHGSSDRTRKEAPMESPVPGLDVGQLKAEIEKTYTAVSSEPEREFVFPTGRAWAEQLDYPPELLRRVPDSACASFAGVASPFSLGRLEAGEDVLDLGSGAGMDSLVASQMVGPLGTVTGIDMTAAMLERARSAA